jgi:hypothetical protein
MLPYKTTTSEGVSPQTEPSSSIMYSQSHAALQAEVDRLHGELEVMKGEPEAGKISIGNYILARLEELGVTVSFLVSAIANL